MIKRLEINKFGLVGLQDMSGWRKGQQKPSDFPTFSLEPTNRQASL